MAKRGRKPKIKSTEKPQPTVDEKEDIQDEVVKEESSFLDKVYAAPVSISELDHRSYVGPKDKYEEIGKHQTEVMKKSGLQSSHKLLDIGCGSLRGGKHLIGYLDRGNYCGIEPNEGLLKKGIKIELDEDIAKDKKPEFNHNNKFDLNVFDCKFDFILAQSIFSHACPEQILKCLKEAEAILNKGGKFVFNYIKGSSDYTGKIWVFPNGCRYTENRMLEFVRKAGLFIEESNFNHPNGLTWLIAIKQ